MSVPCWCPDCDTVREVRVTASTCLVVCQDCGRAWTPGELVELAFGHGYLSALAEVSRLAHERAASGRGAGGRR